MFYKWIIGMIFCTLVICADALSAGSKQADTHVPVTTIFTGNQCKSPYDKLKVMQLTNQEQLDTFIRQNTHTIRSPLKNNLTSIDFLNDVVVAILMKKKPTAGYGISLEEKSAEIKDHIAIVQVNLKKPDPDTMLAQVMTSPCLLIKLPKGRYDTIKFFSQHSELLAALSIHN